MGTKSIFVLVLICLNISAVGAEDDAITAELVRDCVLRGSALSRTALNASDEDLIRAFEESMLGADEANRERVVFLFQFLVKGASKDRQELLNAAIVRLASDYLTVDEFKLAASRLRVAEISDSTKQLILDRFWRSYERDDPQIVLTALDIDVLSVLGGPDEMQLLKAFRDKKISQLTDSSRKWYRTEAGKAIIALARMGSEEDIKHLIEAVREHADNVDKFGHLFNVLASIKDWRVVELVAGYLTDETPSAERLGFDVYVASRREQSISTLERMLAGFPRDASAETQLEWLDDVSADPPWKK